MPSPLFFHSGIPASSVDLELEEDTARHIVQVLRMTPGEEIRLTDGKGMLATTHITRAEKKKCSVCIIDTKLQPVPSPQFQLCVAFTRNAGRNEWLLEKAVELGVRTIIPVLAERSEKERFKASRWQNIVISALIQSQQYFLPELMEPLRLPDILNRFAGTEQKLIAHCMSDRLRFPLAYALQPGKDTALLIGPEGDFTQAELELCLSKGFTGISLGNHRLRTETAAMAACAYFNLINHEA